MGLMINPAPTFTLNDGSVASEGKLYFYENGSTTIEKDVFLKPNLDPLQKLNNPLTLTDAGRLPTCFGTGTYTIVLESAAGVQQWVRNDVTIDDLTGQFADYSTVKNYNINEIVRYTDGNYYYSLANNNKGNTPSVNSEWWAQIAFLEFFNTAKAADADYMLNDIVISGGFIYRSLENNNGDTPPSAKWANLTFNDSVAGNFAIGGDLSVTGEATIGGGIEAESFGGPSSSTAKFPSGKIQIGPDAGPKFFINSDGEASDDDLSYLALAKRSSVRVELGGGFNAGEYIVLEKIGSNVTVTSVGRVSHPSNTSATSDAIIPAEYRIGDDYTSELGVIAQTINATGYITRISVTYDGKINVTHYDYSGSLSAQIGPGFGFSFSYTITSDTP